MSSIKWTRDDLPEWVLVSSPSGRGGDKLSPWIRDGLVDHLNEHHPKPEFEGYCTCPGYDSGGLMGDCGMALHRAQWRAGRVQATADRLRRAHEIVEGERDQARRERDEAREQAEAADRECAAALKRAEKAEQLIPAYAMLDVWLALGRDSIHFDDWREARDYADAWAELTAAIREAAEAHTAPVVDRDVVEANLVDGLLRGFTANQLAAAVCAAIDGDPAVFVIHQSELEDAPVRRRSPDSTYGGPGAWEECDETFLYSKGVTAEDLDEEIEAKREGIICALSVKRALAAEAEQATDPLLDKARELWEVAQGDGPYIVWEALIDPERERYLRMAAHVLGQEAGDA